MSMSIPNSIILWANSDHPASGARGLLSEDLVTQLKTHIRAESHSIHNDDLLKIILEIIKNPKFKEQLSTSGRGALSLAITDLKRRCKEDIENSPPKGFFAKIASMASGGSKAIDAMGDRITHKLEKADAARLIYLIDHPDKQAKAGELAGLIVNVLPHMPKREHREACRKIALNNIANEIFRKNDLGLIKALARELYKSGMLYRACRLFTIADGITPDVKKAIVDAIKEDMSIRPKWSIGQYLSAGPSHSLHIPAQESRFTRGGFDDTKIVDDLIVTAAKEKVEEKFVFGQGHVKFEELLRKSFAISFSENSDNIVPKEVVDAKKRCGVMFSNLERYLPRQDKNRTVDRLRTELDELFKQQTTRNNLETIQRKLEHLVRNSKLRPDIMKNILADSKLLGRDVKFDSDFRVAVDALIKSRNAKSNNENYIEFLITAHKAFERLLEKYPDDFKDIGHVATYNKRISQIDGTDAYSIKV